MTGRIVVFAKQPRPGAVKTRLCPPFEPAQAAELYAHMLADVLAVTADSAARLDLAAVLAVHPGSARAELAGSAPAAFRVVAQRGASLAERMEWAAFECAAQGPGPVLLRGSDSPLMDADLLASALAALDAVDVALSPDPGGGYGLVALRSPVAGLFDHAMSTPTVLEDTLANAGRLGLHAVLLAPGLDIDTAADLAALAAERPRAARMCPRTLAFLDAGRLWPASSRVLR